MIYIWIKSEIINLYYGRSFIESVFIFDLFLLASVDENDSFASFDEVHPFPLAHSALESEGNLFSGFGLLMEYGFRLSSETCLFHVVSSSSYFLKGWNVEEFKENMQKFIRIKGPLKFWKYFENIFIWAYTLGKCAFFSFFVLSNFV